MQKLLSTLFALISVYSLQAQSLKYPTATRVIDVSGSRYFTYKISGTRVDIQERDYKDSVTASIHLNDEALLSEINYLQIRQFGSSDKFLICVSKNLRDCLKF